MSKLLFLNWLLSILLLLNIAAYSQTATLENILHNGDPSKFINFVFLGDGYTESELNDFVNHAEDITDYLFTISPFKEYKNYFNVYVIKVSSAESGAKHPRTASDCPPAHEHPVSSADNYYGSTFDYYDIHRLLVAVYMSAINNIVSTHFPQSDVNLMIVNSPYYGGSGGWTATGSIHPSANEIMVHEIGHTFGHLADEYWAGDFYAGEYANMTQESDPELIKWKNWLGYEGVGIYVHGTSGEAANWYRPHQSCKMRYLGYDFCAVCKETLALRILNLFGNPFKDKYPEETTVVFENEEIMFTIDLYNPEPNTIKTVWLLNQEVIAVNSDTIYIHPDQLSNKQTNNLLNVQFRDTTAYIRAETNTYEVSWILERSTLANNLLDIENEIKAWPNPFDKSIIIHDTQRRDNLAFDIYNSAGQLITNGVFDKETEIRTEGWQTGSYFIRISIENEYEILKLLKE